MTRGTLSVIPVGASWQADVPVGARRAPHGEMSLRPLQSRRDEWLLPVSAPTVPAGASLPRATPQGHPVGPPECRGGSTPGCIPLVPSHAACEAVGLTAAEARR